jgi:hypothetical protein
MNPSSTVVPGSVGTKTILISVAIGLFVGLVAMFALNAKYNFLPDKWDLFKRLGLVKSHDAAFWTDPNALTALALDQTELPGSFPSRYGYSMMFDTTIYNSRASFTASSGNKLPYRHLVHRGSNDLGNAGTAAGCGGGGGSSAAAAAAADGLPQFMNPGFVADRTTNDIIVFIDTSAGRESARISNLQLTVPYRIGIIVYQGFFELYLGCKLLTTQILQGIPIAITSSGTGANASGLYALAGSYALSAKIQNVRLWSKTLPVQQIITECSVPMQPFGSAPPCSAVLFNPAAPTPSAPAPAGSPAAAAAATIASVTKCPTTPAAS